MKKQLFIGLGATFVIILTGFLLIAANQGPTVASQDKVYTKNPSLVKAQDSFTAEEKQKQAASDQQPLLQQLPYSDSYIYINHSDKGPTDLVVRYTTSEEDAKQQYAQVLKQLGDSGAGYQVSYLQVNTLPEAGSEE